MHRKIKLQSGAVLLYGLSAFVLLVEVLSSAYAEVNVAATQRSSEATVSGMITDAFGARLDDATISLFSADRVIQAKTDSQGQFHLSNVPPGTYQLEAVHQGFKTRKIAALQIIEKNAPLSIMLDIAAAGPCDRIHSVSYVEASGERLRGVVLASKQAVAGAEIDLVSASGAGVLMTQRSGRKGEFVFPNLEPGQYLLIVARSGYGDERTESFWVARANTTKVEIEMIKDGWMRVCQ